MPSYYVNVGSDDGNAYRTGASYPPGTPGSDTTDTVVNMARYQVGGPNFGIACGLLRFDTSGIPDDATINSATLRVYVSMILNADSRSLTAGYYDAETIDADDWVETAETDAHAGTALASLTSSTTNDLSLLNPDANISKTGYTGLRLHISGGLPAGNNQVNIASYEDTNPQAELIVDYTEAGTAPSLRTVRSSQRW